VDETRTHLGRADVARRLVATDVLLARLQREAVRRAAVGVLRQADEAAGHAALEAVLAGEEGGVRAAVAERDAEASGVAERDVGAPLAGRLDGREGEEVGRAQDEAAEVVRALGDALPVGDVASQVRVLRAVEEGESAVRPRL